MLSKKNLEKIDMNGLYRHEPVASWRGQLYANDPYWCCNWTFRPIERNGTWYMLDTYWLTGNCVCVELTDENIDEFELLFDFDDVIDVGTDGTVVEPYDEKDWLLVPIDSGGINFRHYFLRKGAKQSVRKMKALFQADIARAKERVEYQESRLRQFEEDYAAHPERYNE